MKKTALLISFIILYSHSYSQVTFAKGYLVELDGDTLKGEVKMNPKKDFDLFNKVFFKDASGVQKNYKPDKVKAYGFDGKHFIASLYEKEMMFYKVLCNGTVRLYEMMCETQIMNEISYKSEYFLSRKDDKEFTRLKPVKYKKQLSEFLKDNPDIVQDTEDDKKFEIEKIADLITRYNNAANSN